MSPVNTMPHRRQASLGGGSTPRAFRTGWLFLLVALVALAALPLEAKTLKDTRKWFGPDGEAFGVVATVEGERVGLDGAVERLLSQAHESEIAPSLRSIRIQVGFDTMPCRIEGEMFRYRPRDPARRLSPKQDWAPWQEDSNRNLRWAHQSLSLLGCYMQGLDGGEKAIAARQIVELLEDWHRQNAVPSPPDPEFSWGDHTAAYRLRRIAAVYLALREHELLDRRAAAIIVKIAYSHTRILLEERQIRMARSNHALDQAQALFISGMTFPFLEYSVPVVEEAYTRAMAESDFLIAADGVQTENSPAYHQWVPPKVFSLTTAMSEFLGQPLAEDFLSKMEGATRFATWITRPDGTLPMIGDTARGAESKFRSHPAVDRELRLQLEYAKSGGEKGQSPEAGLAYFEDSGYLIYRNAWSKGLQNDDAHLVFKCGFVSHGHRHADDGNLVLFAFGSDWLTDAGMYGYEHQSPGRIYAIGPLAHNVSVPLETETVRRMSHPRYREHRDSWGMTAERSSNSALCRSFMYVDTEYRRRISLSSEGIRLDDAFVGGDLDGRRISTLFRIPLDKRFELDRKAGRARICDSAERCLRIDFDDAAIAEIAVSEGADEHGPSFDTEDYLDTRDIRTLRLFWKDGVRYARFHLDFENVEVFQSGLAEPAAAPPPEPAFVAPAAPEKLLRRPLIFALVVLAVLGSLGLAALVLRRRMHVRAQRMDRGAPVVAPRQRLETGNGDWKLRIGRSPWTALVVLGAISLVQFSLFRAPPMLADALDYFSAAWTLGETEPSHRHLRIGLLWPLWLLQRLFGYSELAYYFLPWFSCALLGVTTWWLGSLMFSARVGWVAGILVMLLPPYAAHISLLLPDYLSAGLFGAVVCLLCMAAKRRATGVGADTWVLLAAGILLGWSYLVREFVVLLFPAIGAMLLLQRTPVRGWLVFGMGAILVYALEAGWGGLMYGDPLVRLQSGEPRQTGLVFSTRVSEILVQFPTRFKGRPGAWILGGTAVFGLLAMAAGILARHRALTLLATWGLYGWALFTAIALLPALVLDENTTYLRMHLFRYWSLILAPVFVAAVGVLFLAYDRLQRARAPVWAVPVAILALLPLVGALMGLAQLRKHPELVRNRATDYQEFRSYVREHGLPATLWMDTASTVASDRSLPLYLRSATGLREYWQGEIRPLNTGRTQWSDLAGISGGHVLLDRSRSELVFNRFTPDYFRKPEAVWETVFRSRNGRILVLDPDRPLAARQTSVELAPDALVLRRRVASDMVVQARTTADGRLRVEVPADGRAVLLDDLASGLQPPPAGSNQIPTGSKAMAGSVSLEPLADARVRLSVRCLFYDSAGERQDKWARVAKPVSGPHGTQYDFTCDIPGGKFQASSARLLLQLSAGSQVVLGRIEYGFSG